MAIEKPEDFYQFYAALKQYRTPTLKAKHMRWYDKEFWVPARCTPEMSVLELGSGPGEFLLYLQRKGVRRFLGVEMDRAAIAAMAPGLDAHVRTGDIWAYLNQAPKDRLWDRVVMLDVLEHFSAAEGAQLLERIKSVLAPGGLVVARVPNMGSPLGGLHQFADITHKAAYSANSLGQLGGAVGYTPVAFLAQKRGSPIRRFLEDMVFGVLSGILTTVPVVWTPNIIVIWRLEERVAA